MKENMFLDVAAGQNNKNSDAIIIKKNAFCQINYCKSDNFKVRKGEYHTIVFDELNLFKNSKYLTKELIKILKYYLKKYNKNYKTLIIGLGNNKIESDSLGPKSLDKIIASNQYSDFLTIPKVALFAPHTTNQTGINSFKLIKMVVDYIHPDIIFIIDSMNTRQATYLNCAIEINDVGIIKAENISYNKEISYKTFNIPIIAIMAPLVLNKAYTSLNVQSVTENIAKIISDAINNIYFNN